jgi:DNA-binding transcriptional regulator YhcF (GntR family)
MAKRGPIFGEFGISLKRDSRIPLHCQLRDALREYLMSGVAPAGTRLPSSRALAEMLGVSRNTVVAAYEVLASEELLVGRHGSGTRAGSVKARLQLEVFGAVRMPREWIVRASVHGRMHDWKAILKASQFPMRCLRFSDPDGNVLCLYDSIAVA